MPNLLKDLRGSRTQAEMASIFGITQQAWSSWESGRTVPKPSIMQMMEDMFQRKKEDIFLKNLTTKCSWKWEEEK